MRKLVALLLLFLMSFQTSWAAIAGYCQHEQGAAVAHVGHHEHRHDAGPKPLAGKSSLGISASSDGASNASASASGGDPDCSVCHAGFLPALMIEPALSVAVLNLSGLAEPAEAHPPAAPLDLPERPNWS